MFFLKNNKKKGKIKETKKQKLKFAEEVNNILEYIYSSDEFKTRYPQINNNEKKFRYDIETFCDELIEFTYHHLRNVQSYNIEEYVSIYNDRGKHAYGRLSYCDNIDLFIDIDKLILKKYMTLELSIDYLEYIKLFNKIYNKNYRILLSISLNEYNKKTSLIKFNLIKIDDKYIYAMFTNDELDYIQKQGEDMVSDFYKCSFIASCYGNTSQKNDLFKNRFFNDIDVMNLEDMNIYKNNNLSFECNGNSIKSKINFLEKRDYIKNYICQYQVHEQCERLYDIYNEYKLEPYLSDNDFNIMLVNIYASNKKKLINIVELFDGKDNKSILAITNINNEDTINYMLSNTTFKEKIINDYFKFKMYNNITDTSLHGWQKISEMLENQLLLFDENGKYIGWSKKCEN